MSVHLSVSLIFSLPTGPRRCTNAASVRFVPNVRDWYRGRHTYVLYVSISYHVIS